MTQPTYFQPHIFDTFPGVVAAHSLRAVARPGANSMLPKGATENEAASNRAAFAQALGFDQIIAPRLEHGAIIYELRDDYDFATRPTADAIMTDQRGKLIGIGVADCIVALLYDPKHHTIAAAHSGWRGTLQNITAKTINAMTARYGTNPSDVVAYLSPSPHKDEYGINLEVAEQFDAKYTAPKSDTDRWLDNKTAVYDQLLAAGVPASQIESDPRSNFPSEFHSFRRDRDASGRHMVVIGLKA